ncbi:MAG TPA: hypothetical protein VNI02_08365 [Blastocatellia bacterium]|jgi:hypothetical protein|nr:hypothetical protein [Blastocatellia bacterium]
MEFNEFTIPYRVAVRDEDAGMSMYAGEESAGMREDDRTLVFDDLHTELLRIEDTELQSELARAFWREICRELSQRGLLEHSGQPVAGYVIPHYLSPPDLLERIREACAGERETVAGFFSEAASLLVGFLRAEVFASMASEFDNSGPLTVCLVVAEDDGELNVACFDYSSEAAGAVSILLRDYFRTTYAQLSDRLKASDWLGAFSALVSLESTELARPSKESLDATLDAVSAGIVREQYQVAGLDGLKARGAAHLAALCSGRGAASGEYRIEVACHIGVRVSRSSFHPVISKEEFARIVDFPYSSLQTFKLEGRPGNEMRVQLYCGSSDRVEDSTLLGHLTLSQSELASLTSGNESVVVAIVKLDTQGSGEFTLGLLPDNRIIGSQSFTLPGLMA